MNNHIQSTFCFDSKSIRTLFINNEPWFVAVDVCNAIGVQNPSQVIDKLEEKERSILNIGRQGEVNIVNESGLYFIMLRARDAVNEGTLAYRFRIWVTQKVLPEIRKTGSYQNQPEAPKRITPQQLRELESKITQASVSFSYRTKAENRIRNNVRHLCGISNIADVPPEQYHRAVALIERSNQIGGQYAGMLCELEEKVLGDLVGYGLALTPELRKQYRAEFDVILPRHVDWSVVQAELDSSRLVTQQYSH